MISIILCTYNDAHFLPVALKSCISQPVEKELILVDDCSTKPFPPEVDKLLNDFKVKVIRHDVNRGLSAARNTGIEASKYSLIIPLDADDFFFPRSLRTLLSAVDDEHSIFYGNIVSAGGIGIPETGLLTRAKFLSDNPLFSSSLFKKEMWYNIGGYKVRVGAHYEDWNFWCRAYMAGYKFKYVPTIVYEHVERGDSMLRTLGVDKAKYVEIATEELKGANIE